MTILFYGDPHGHYRPLFEAVEVLEPEAVIILGDFQLTVPLEQQLKPILNKTEIWFIHGNHDTDTDEYYHHLFDSELKHRNLHGRVEEIAGYRIAGLGGVFRGNVWHPDLLNGSPKWETRKQFMQAQSPANKRRAKPYNGIPRQHNSSIWFEDYEKLFDQRADILVTHEAPSCYQYGFKELDELAGAMRVDKLFHGHHHVTYADEINTGLSTVTVHGVGLACLKDENGEEI